MTLGRPAEEVEHAHVGPEEGGEVGGGEDFGVGVVGSAQAGAEHRGLEELPGMRIDDALRLPGEIHEDLLPGPVVLTHDHVDGAFEGAVVVAELGILQSISGMIVSVFDPELLERHPRAPKFPVQVFVVGFDPSAGRAGVAGI